MKAVAKSLIRSPANHTDPRTVLELLKKSYTRTVLSLMEKNYLQIGGTAMGTKLAPSYANIFMGDLEERLLSKWEKDPFFWARFIDDIFMIWTHSPTDLLKFLDYLKSSHQTIKFTMEYSKKE